MMDKKFKQALIDEFTKLSTNHNPVTIKHNGMPIVLLYPIEEPQKFQVKRDQEFQQLKTELNHLSTFIRCRIKQLPEEVETQLATHRQKIKEALQ